MINLYLRMGDKKDDNRKRENKSTIDKGTEAATIDSSEGDNDTIEPPTLKPPLPPRKRKSFVQYFRPGAFSKRY